MKQTARTNGRLTITPPVSPFWTAVDYAHETETLRSTVWPAIQKLLAAEWPGFSAAFTSDEIVLCTHCRAEFEALTAMDPVDFPNCMQDEHSVEGEPVCCDAAIAEFRTERGIPQVGGAQ